MRENKSAEFSIDFGRTARTIHYLDPHGELTFTFDLNSKRGDRALFLEISDGDDRSAAEDRYDIAVDRAKQFLESCGYEVEIEDPRTFDHAAVEAEIERNRAEAIASGEFTMRPLRKPIEKPHVEGWWHRLFGKFS